MKKYFRLLFYALLSLSLFAGVIACSDSDDKKSSTYSVSFDNYLGMTPSTNPVIAERGGVIKLPTPINQGRTFDGWYDNGVKVGVGGDNYTVSKSTRLTARWLGIFTVSFVDSETTPPAPLNAEENGYITLPSPMVEHRTLEGWYSGANRVGGPGENYRVTGFVTLSAKWTDTSYTINFDNVSPAPASLNGIYNSIVKLPPASKAEHVFEGWFDGATRAGGANDNYTITGSKRLNALWTQLVFYNVSFSDHVTLTPTENPVRRETGTVIKLPNPGMKTNHTFMGWYDGGTLAGVADDNYTVTKNATLAAQWRLDTIPTYTVTFDTSTFDSMVPPTNPRVEEENVVIPLPAPSKAHYDFLGWFDGVNPVGKTDYTVTKNVTLAAQWQIKQYTVTYDNVTTAIPARTENANTVIQLPDPVAPVNFAFEGWYDGINRVGGAGGDYTITKTVALRANFNSTIVQYTVTFDNATGVPAPRTENAGTVIQLPTPTPKAGMTFEGWYDGMTRVGGAGGNYTVAKTVALRANFVPAGANVTITFNYCFKEAGMAPLCVGTLVPGAVCNASAISGAVCTLPQDTVLMFPANRFTLGSDNVLPAYPLPVVDGAYPGNPSVRFLHWSVSSFSPDAGYFECNTSNACYDDPSLGIMQNAPAIIPDPKAGGNFTVDKDYIFNAVYGRGC